MPNGEATERSRPANPRRIGKATTLLAAFLCALTMLAAPARAQIGSDRYSSIIVDSGTGRVLEEAAADEPRYPASLTKLMTLYLVFEALRDRRIGLDQPVPISEHAASMVPSKLGLLPGMELTVEEAILGVVTKSANDAAAALGELLGGDEDRFAQMMTLRARSLGLSRTTFRNASGLPDPDQVTTARDLAVLARHLIGDFPDAYHYFSTPDFMFHGRIVYNHDRMLQTYPGADGLKTGYTEAAGHNLITSALRGGVRLIGVVMGAATNPERDLHMAALLDDGFEKMDVPVEPRTIRNPELFAAAQAAPLPRSFRGAPREASFRTPERLFAATPPRRPILVSEHAWRPASRPIARGAVPRGNRVISVGVSAARYRLPSPPLEVACAPARRHHGCAR